MAKNQQTTTTWDTQRERAENEQQHSREPAPTVTQRDRAVSQQLAREAADLAARDAKDRALIAKCKSLLATLAAIQPNAPGYGDEYVLSRLGQRGRVTVRDIETAREIMEDRVGQPPRPATATECIAALRPLAKMPRDYLNENKHAIQFSFPDGTGKSIDVTLAQIEAAEILMADHGQ